VNDVTRLQALVDKKKVVVTEATIRDALRLDDVEGVECLPNEEIFTELARMGYEKPSTKLTFYKAFFSSQWKFLINTILQCMSAKRTSWNEFSSSMASAVICLSSGRKLNFSKYIFDSTVRNVDSPSKFYMDADENVENVNAGDAAEGDVSAAHDKMVKKLGRRNKVKVLKLRRLQKVGTTQRVETSDETIIDDVSNQGRMIAKMDQDADVVLKDDKEVADDVKDVQDDIDESAQDQGRKAESQAEIYKIDLEHANKVLSMQEDESEPAKVQEVVDVVTTSKIITEVVTAASETITAASTTITVVEAQVLAVTLTAAPERVTAAPSRKRKRVVIRDPQEESTTFTIIPAETKSKDKEQIEEEESKALKRLNETPAEKAAKRQKLDEEVEELKIHLQIVPNEDDDDVYTEATPLACKERFAKTKPKNFSDDFLLITLGAMFEKPDIDAQIWKNQRSVHGPAKVKGWKLLESCGVQIITFTTTQLILLVERKYSLTRFTLDQMLNAVRLKVEEESEVSLELLSFGVDAAKEFKEKHAKCLMLLVKDLVLPSQADVVD
nr:synaptobrevin, longin-like domain protein [Tanacetum cinerariifolium]